MTLREWVEQHRDEVIAEPSDAAFLAMHQKLARRELEDAEGVRSHDGQIEHAHAACLAIARAALAASGYRVRSLTEAHHYLLLDSLRYTLALTGREVEMLQGYRKLRHRVMYQQVGAASESVAQSALAFAHQLLEKLREKLGST